MTIAISHDRADESLEAKARWFKSLSFEARMDLFFETVEIALAMNPGLMERKNAQRPQGSFQVVERK